MRIKCPTCGIFVRGWKRMVNHFRNEHVKRGDSLPIIDIIRRIKGANISIEIPAEYRGRKELETTKTPSSESVDLRDAHQAAWDVALSDTEVRELAQGVSPNLIRPQNLLSVDDDAE